MTKAVFDVLTIGNAITDVLAESDDGFLEREGMTKGIMHLIEGGRADYLYDLMPETKQQISGGSAANSAMGKRPGIVAVSTTAISAAPVAARSYWRGGGPN